MRRTTKLYGDLRDVGDDASALHAGDDDKNSSCNRNNITRKRVSAAKSLGRKAGDGLSVSRLKGGEERAEDNERDGRGLCWEEGYGLLDGSGKRRGEKGNGRSGA